MIRNRRFLILVLTATLLAGCDQKPPASPQVNAPPINLAADIARAKTESKLLLLEFGSSDACPPCMLFEEKVFTQPEFKDYAVSNLVFVRVDFPAKHKLPPAVEATNILLGQQFDILPFPTFVALDPDGKEFWRMPAKDDPNPGIPGRLFSPQGFISLVEAVKAQRK